MTFLLNFI